MSAHHSSDARCTLLDRTLGKAVGSSEQKQSAMAAGIERHTCTLRWARMQARASAMVPAKGFSDSTHFPAARIRITYCTSIPVYVMAKAA